MVHVLCSPALGSMRPETYRGTPNCASTRKHKHRQSTGICTRTHVQVNMRARERTHYRYPEEAAGTLACARPLMHTNYR
eukprot:1950351-Pleurochrysis_carterae.AAC.2